MVQRATVAAATVIMLLSVRACLAADGAEEPAGGWTGRAVMIEQLRRHKPACETALWRMVLTDRHGRERERQLRQLRLTTEGDVDRVLLVCLAPADVRGTAVVTRETPDSPDDGQWLYLPSQHRSLRIAEGRRASYAMGSDFTYEDLDPGDLDSFHWRVVGEETQDDHACFLIEAVPAGKREARRSGYSKRLLYVDKETFVTRRLEFFDRGGRNCKSQTNRAFEETPAGPVRAREMEMVNRLKKHRTLLVVESVDFEEQLEEKHFSRHFVTSGRCIE